MSRDIYSSLSGAKAAWTQLESVANNLSNTNTTGFKEQRMTFKQVGASQQVLADSYVKADQVYYDMSDGALQHTGEQNHLAIRGRGFFQVQTEEGTLLQRAGNFRSNSDGFLVNDKGQKVLGEGGPIEIPDRKDFTVAQDGAIRTIDGEEIGTIKVVEADALKPVGHSQWKAEDGTFAAKKVEIIQGSLEGSNADPVRGMIQLVEASRYFEMYQKAMQTSDTLDTRTNEIMRSR
jgi:flagellar basal-body rod protein FlgF